MKILFLGDSITDVGRDRDNPSSLGEGYPLLIGSRLGADFPGQHTCRNTGISGNRIVDLYARIKVDCWNWQPDVLSILVGINDTWHNLRENPNGVGTGRFHRLLQMLVEDTLARMPDCTLLLMEPFVLLGTATAENWQTFAEEVPQRAQAVREVAEQFHAHFLPLQSLLDDACKRCPPEHWLADGVHPTSAGHQLIADAWLDLFRREIAQD